MFFLEADRTIERLGREARAQLKAGGALDNVGLTHIWPKDNSGTDPERKRSAIAEPNQMSRRGDEWRLPRQRVSPAGDCVER
jgi:hypothetical protein